jgi:flagellar hook-associated protein 2
MATSIGPNYDPTSTAVALAEKYTAGRQSILTAQTKQASAASKGLNDLGAALSTFQSSLLSLTGAKKTMFAQAATFSDTAFGTASASASASAGSYAFFVEKIATASQVSYSGLTDDAGIGGTLGIKLGGANAFDVDLASADTDNNGTLTTRELAAAINAAPNNTSLVTASIVTTGTTSELVLTAKNTGAAGAITLDTGAVTSEVPDASSLATANATPARVHILVQAQDAVIRIGTETGTAITQATNSFTNVDGVTMTFIKAQATGSAPLTLTVGADNATTTANVQAFVDAYNKLKAAIDGLVAPGDPSKGQAGGAFAHDGGMRALRDRLVGLMRPTAGGTSLAAFGIIATRTGTLELRAARLTSQLALDPTGLDKLIGSTGSPASGIAGALDSFLQDWNSSVNGKIKGRKEQNATLQRDLTVRQAKIDQQYDAAYKRYLMQFTQLQAMQSQMSTNVSMFDALFGEKSK